MRFATVAGKRQRRETAEDVPVVPDGKTIWLIPLYDLSMPSRPRLRLRPVAVCVSLGVILNIAVAWACTLPVDPRNLAFVTIDRGDASMIDAAEVARLSQHPRARAYSDAQVVIGVERHFGCERRVVVVMQYWLAALQAGAKGGVGPFHSNDDFDVRIRAGWPLPALEGRRTYPEDDPIENAPPGQRLPDPFHYSWLLRVGRIDGLSYMRRPPTPYPRYLLPMRPLWPGFAIDSALCALLVWLLFWAPFALRRAVRRRRNLCERCGYPRGASQRCSECGATWS